MPSGGQVAAATGIAVPVLVASGLAIGGYHNRPLAAVCFVLAALVVVVAGLWVPFRNRRWRVTGRTPIRATHKVIGGHALLFLDLGTEAAVTDAYCELHIPHYMFVGGRPKAMAQVPYSLEGQRRVTFDFPNSFGLAPIFSQVACVGWYHINWVITQFGAQRVISDRFKIRKFGFVALIRQAWERHGEQNFATWLAIFAMYYLLGVTGLARFGPVQRGWNRLFAPKPTEAGDDQSDDENPGIERPIS